MEIPLRISLFGWRVLHSLYPFPEVLHHMGFSIVSKCYACKSIDSLDHCFAQCPLAKQVWFFFEDILQVILLHHNVYPTFSFCWRSDLHFESGKRRLISHLPLAISCGIWLVTNAFLFNNVAPTLASAIYHALDVLRTISHLKPFIFSDSEAFLAQCLGGPFFSTKTQLNLNSLLGKNQPLST